METIPQQAANLNKKKSLESPTANNMVENNLAASSKPEQGKNVEFPATSDPVSLKRALSSTASTVSDQEKTGDKELPQEKIPSQIKSMKKKIKIPPAPNKSDIERHLESAKEYFTTNQQKCYISYDEFKKFFINTYGNPNIAEIAQNYTNDLSALHNLLTDVHSHVDNRGNKSRITRIRKCLQSAAQDGNREDMNSDDAVSTDGSIV